MCTLIVLDRCVSDRPLVVAANRDEFLDRPAEGPALRSTRTGPIVAPLDLEAGGTWLGLSARGVFAGLTNLRAESVVSSEAGPDPLARRSRGEVVMAALESATTDEALQRISQLEEDSYNPFQLLVSDGRRCALVVYRGRPRVVELEPGVHVVGNVEDEGLVLSPASGSEARRPEGSIGESPGSPFQAGCDGRALGLDTAEPGRRKLTRVRERVEKLMTDPDRDLFEGLAGICREHVGGEGPSTSRASAVAAAGPPGASPFESTCVHVADRYGTRSSLLLELAIGSRESRLWTTDGPPCVRPFANRSSLLRELGLRPGV